MRGTILRFTALMAIYLCAGCSFLGPLPDRTHFFVLTPLPGGSTGADVTMPTQGTVYGLGPIRLPAYIERMEIATRTSAAEITYSQNDYWAESLSTNMTSVLMHNLETLLGTERVVLYPWAVDVGVDYQIQIAFLRFEGDAAGEVQLTARWSVTDAHDGRQLLAREAALARLAKAGDTTARVAALSAALGSLSEEIAGALRTLPAPRATR